MENKTSTDVIPEFSVTFRSQRSAVNRVLSKPGHVVFAGGGVSDKKWQDQPMRLLDNAVSTQTRSFRKGYHKTQDDAE